MASDASDSGSPPDRDVKPDLDDDDIDMAEASFLSRDSKADGTASYEGTPNGKSKSSKDPQRPRRKKARRACHACQRAHLTCGDERPCQRCVKRGLQDQCQDGFRKKAKYLHDAPPEALIPPNLGGAYTFSEAKTQGPQNTTTPQTPMAQQQAYFPPAPAMDLYTQSQTPMAALIASSAGSFGNIATPISPFNLSGAQTGQMNAPALPQGGPNLQTQPQAQQQTQHIPFDPSDPAIFNFNIDGLNFGNRYGALEFGMLQSMANGVNDDAHGDVVTPLNQVPSYSLNFSGNPPAFDQNSMMNLNYAVPPRHPPSYPEMKTPNNTPIIKSADITEVTGSAPPYAYAIGAPQRPNSLASASPVSLSQDTPVVSENNNTGSPALFAAGGEFAVSHQQHHHHQPVQHPHSAVSLESMSATSGLQPTKKRSHNGDSIYGRIQKPYSYHAGWHRLFSYIKTHFSKENVQRIAQYVSVIRPPLTAFAQSLSVHDLIFMETTLQRQLFEYREFIKATGTPTIVTRRDGTILAVSEEFCKMTRWSESIVLGKEKNMNVNRGYGLGKNAMLEDKIEGSGGAGQALLISEVFDQQTVVDFFNDYARLAFGDPMGRALRRGKLLRYVTKEEALNSQLDGDVTNTDNKVSTTQSVTENNSNGATVSSTVDREDPGIANESAFVKLGEKEGVVDCMYCWWMRRDLFEVPALIVINFLPVIPNQ